MRRRGALLPGLLLALLTGCATGELAHPGTLLDRLSGAQALPPEAVQMEVAVIERPLSDPYLNKDLWTFTDEQVVALEHKEVLDDNGFRVGQVVGMAPSGLQALLTSKRSCVNHRLYLLGAGKSATLVLGPSIPHCRFLVAHAGQPVEVSLDQAQFSVIVMPALTADGRTRLHFTPQVQYGEKHHDFRVAPDDSGLMMEIGRYSKTYPALGWDVTLRPNQYVIVGPRPDQTDSLGTQEFVQPEGPTPVQRLLVIRTNRAATALDEEDADAARDPAASGGPPPLALQATWTSAGGTSSR
jgi:hypothetical protein